MSLEGSTKDFGLSDIFQLILVQQKSGVMTIWDRSQRASVAFVKGMVVSAQSGDCGVERIGDVLMRAGRLTSQQLDQALKNQKETGRYLGQILISQNAVTRSDLTRALRSQILQVVYQLFRWSDGSYRFEQRDVEYPREFIEPISTEHVLMEGVRQLDEWPALEQVIPSMDAVFAASGDKARSLIQMAGPSVDLADRAAVGPDDDPFMGATEPADDQWSPEEIAVFEAVNGVDSVTRIVELVQQGEFEVCKALGRLLQAGFIDRVDEPLSIPPSERMFSAERMARWAMHAGRWTLNLVLISVVVGATGWLAWEAGHLVRQQVGGTLFALRTLTTANDAVILRDLALLRSLERGAVIDLMSVSADLGDDRSSDSWSRPWQYDRGTGDVWSFGEDGVPGTEDDLR